MRSDLISSVLVTALVAGAAASASAQTEYAWRYYRPSNTGIQGDSCEAIHIGPDGDPWIGGYDAGFEEGGIAKFVQAENRWVNISNVDYQVIGHPEDTGTSRVSDIVADASGRMWMATGRGALVFDPAVGPSSLVRYGADNSPMPGGWCEDVDIAPDGTVWFATRGTVWGWHGINRYNPATGQWAYWDMGAELLSVRPKAGGGYFVWISTGNNGIVSVFDSATQAWTSPAYDGSAGQISALPGKDATDDAGNFWALRATTPGDPHRLDYQRPNGTWVSPPEPYPGFGMNVAVFRAMSDRRALLIDGGSRVWSFNGTTWSDLGVWRPGSFSSAVAMDAQGNVWASGVGGAARRDAVTGQWQRYRITNTSQYDFFNNDLTVSQATGEVWACANAGPGFGGMVGFDGTRWIGFNEAQYGLGQPWPFPTDNSGSIYQRPSTGAIVVNPMFNGTSQLTGTTWAGLPGGSATVIQYVEDSTGRLWALGEYFNLSYWNGSAWINVDIAAWGSQLRADPDRPGTVWAHAGYEVVRTDGAYRFSRTIDDFPELTSQSDTIWGMAPERNGIVWLGVSVMLGAGGSGGGLIRLDSNTGTYSIMTFENGWSLPGSYVTPWAVTPDGRIWMTYTQAHQSYEGGGLCWYDPATGAVGTFPGPVPSGSPVWAALPHTQIKDMEVRLIPGGYELWMSCLSRGIAVLSVTDPACPSDVNGDGESDVLDFLDFMDSFGTCENQPAPCAGSSGVDADFNGDTLVDVLDFLDFFDAFGVGC